MIEAWFDGVCEPRNPGGHGAWGALVKIDGKEVMAQGGYCGVGREISNNVAEYSAFITVAEEIMKHPGVAIIRGDSKLVINQLNGEWGVNGGLYVPFYEKAMKLWMKLRDRTQLTWIPREQNDVCDYLSKKVLHDRGVQFRIQPEK